MPGGNRTGPLGHGHMTGRRAGYCAGNAAPGYVNPSFRRGAGFGGGRGWGGRGWRHRYWLTGMTGWQRATGVAPEMDRPAAEDDVVASLRDKATYLEGALAEIKKRIKELVASKDKE